MFSKKVIKNLGNASWIRSMFEEGERLRKIHGSDKVFDFSLGNPDVQPPIKVKEVLLRLIQGQDDLHKYMNNAGFLDVRQKIADKISLETNIQISASNVVMSCGAAGGLNVVLKTLLNPGEEVIVFSPFFAEYNFYIENHLGVPVHVPTTLGSFQPDLEFLKSKISENTKAIIINSPNNPSGTIYPEDCLRKISALIEDMEKKFGTNIFTLSDEPYNKIVYDNAKVPSILNIFKNSILINSFSKSLSLPGERIGYIVANPAIEKCDVLMSGLIFCNRTLGYVNAPALFQKVIAEVLDEKVNINEYQKRRDLLYHHLINLGFSCVKPEGAFYLFPKALIDDDIEFVKRALKYNLLLVPGKGFGCPGYFRIAYCVSMKTIEHSLTAFTALANEFKGCD